MATVSKTFSVRNGLDVANTIVLDANRNISNIDNLSATTANLSTANASTFITTAGLNVTDQANNARNQANTARGTANDAYAQANTARDTANDAYGQANTARNTANDSYGQANTARDQANTARTTANDSYGQANTARDQANTARTTANDAYGQANAAYDAANNRVLRSGDTMTGNLTVNAFINTNNIFVNKKTDVSPPSTSNVVGERLRLFDFENPGQPNYAIGVEGNHIWTATDDNTGQTGFKWYGNTTQAMLLKSNGDLYLSNTANAKAFVTIDGLNVTDQANNARNQANSARSTANGAYEQANGAYGQANGAYAQANGAYDQANGAYGQANGAYTQANGAYAQANSSANTVRVYANSDSALSNKFLNFVNTASIQVSVTDNLDGNANISFVTTGAAVADAYAQANAAYGQANAAYGQANSAYGQANDAYSQANASYGQANAAYAQANSGYAQANAGYAQANAAYGQANAAYGEANLKLNLTGGTISGDLTVSGNLFLSQNTTLINVTTFQVDDPLIYLASNNDISDVVDIGFIGGKNTSSVYSHTGLIRHAADQKYYLFDGLPDEAHTNNVVNVAASFLATLRANIEANSILLVGETVATQANLTIANDQANAAYGQANAAYAQANASYGSANDAYAQANTARGTANDAYGQANSAYGQANDAYGQANTARNTANDSYAQANTARNQANTAYGQANAAYGQANDAYSQANSAYAAANNRVLKAGDTMTGGLTITTSGEGLKVANANVTNYLSVGSLNVTTNTVTTSTTGQVILDTFALTAHASAKYFVQANSGTDYTVTEVIVMHDGTNIYLTEYGTIQSGPSLGIFSADIDSGNARLLFTANNNVNTIRSVRYGVLVP